MRNNRFIPAHVNYKDLITYRKALIIYDATVYFCHKFIDKHDRIVEQMIQAARSGKLNIVEGCMASGTSKETEIKLIDYQIKRLEQDFIKTGGPRPCTMPD